MGYPVEVRISKNLILRFQYFFSFTCSPATAIKASTNIVIWKNPRPSSSRFCRLIEIPSYQI